MSFWLASCFTPRFNHALKNLAKTKQKIASSQTTKIHRYRSRRPRTIQPRQWPCWAPNEPYYRLSRAISRRQRQGRCRAASPPPVSTIALLGWHRAPSISVTAMDAEAIKLIRGRSGWASALICSSELLMVPSAVFNCCFVIGYIYNLEK